MAKYSSHCAFNTLIFLPLTLIVVFKFFSLPLSTTYMYVGAFLYGTFFMSPDMDVADKIKLFSLRGLLSLPFRIYSKLFKHRGISHIPIIGTLSRIIWLIVFGLSLFFIIYQTFAIPQPLFIYIKEHKSLIAAMIIGLSFADISHLLLDMKRR